MSAYDDLKAANEAYHAAVNGIFCESAGSIPIDELAKVKAEFGTHAHIIFKQMQEAQKIVEPYYT